MTVENRIKKVLEGKSEQEVLGKISPDEVITLLDEIGLEDDGEPMETNGWQVDYWVRYPDHKGHKYVLSGCMFYGTATFTRVGK